MTEQYRRILLALTDLGIKSAGINLFSQVSGADVAAAIQALRDMKVESCELKVAPEEENED